MPGGGEVRSARAVPMQFRILGALEVRSGGEAIKLAGVRRRTLLAVLLVSANQVVGFDRMIEDLWDGSPPEAPKATLHAHVSYLRRALALDELVTEASGYRLHVDAEALDALRFERAVAEVRGSAASEAEVAARLEQALAWWRGPALVDFDGKWWAQPTIARLEELRLDAVERLTEARLALGEHQALVGLLDSYVREHPLRERLWGQLMLALYRSGRQADALRAYGRLRIRLRDELGIEPTKDLSSLEEAILVQKPELDWVPPGGAATALRATPRCEPAPEPGPDRTALATAVRRLAREPLVGRIDDLAVGLSRLARRGPADLVDAYGAPTTRP